MSLYTVVGDPHAKPDNLDKINTLFDIVEDLGNPAIVLGDALDTKELVRGTCLNTYINRLKSSKLEWIFLVGNHDWFNLQCVEHSLEALKALPNVTVVDEGIVKHDLAFLPYIHDPIEFKRRLAWCSFAKTVFCHVDIKGFDFGNGRICEEGLEASDFEHLNVISGHFHKYQKVGNVTYLGTPFSHSFGETDQDKFIGIFDSKTGAMELIPTPFGKHMTLTVDCSKQKQNLAAQFNPENKYRIILKGTQEEINKFFKVDGIRYIEQPTDVVKAATIVETDTPEKQFTKWAKDIKGYSKDLVNLGLEIMKNV